MHSSPWGAAALLVTALLAGCSQADAPQDGAAAVEVPPGTSQDGFAGAREDVPDFSCTRDERSWVVAGTVANPLPTPVDYRIYTSFLDPSGSTLAVSQRDVGGVEPGESAEWDDRVELDAVDVECVLRVERSAG